MKSQRKKTASYSFSNMSKAEMALGISLGLAVPMIIAGIAVTQALLAVALLSTIIIVIRQKHDISLFLAELTNPITGALVLMFAIWAVVSIFSQDIVESLSVVIRMVVYIAGITLVWAVLGTRPLTRELSVKIAIVSALITLVFAVAVFALPPDMQSWATSFREGNVPARSAFKRYASAAMLLAPFALWAGWHYGSRYRWIGGVVAVLSVALAVLTYNRAAVAGYMAAVLVVAFLLLIVGHRMARLALAGFAIVSAVGLVVVAWMRSALFDLSISVPGTYLPEWMLDPHRQIIWKFTMERFAERPFTGWGINTINLIPGSKNLIPVVGGEFISSHPHNWMVEVLAETGVFGLAALVVVLALVARGIVRTYVSKTSAATMAAGALAGSYVVSNLFNFSVWSSWWQLSFMTLFAILLAHARNPLPAADKTGKKRALIVTTEDWAFLRHRVPTASALESTGAEVWVIANDNGNAGKIRERGWNFVHWGIERGSMNPLGEWDAMHRLAQVVAELEPAVVHNVAIKPILYGSISALLTSQARIVNLFSGLGVLFISPSAIMKLARNLALVPLRIIFSFARVLMVVQNSDDAKELNALGLSTPEKTMLIPGSGVDTSVFSPVKEAQGTPVALVVSRMLWDKGIGETIDAARMLKKRGVNIIIRLAGSPDPENPATISKEHLTEWSNEGLVEWLGEIDDVAAELARAHIALLPSYREGMPKSLLEGAAMGRALVAFDAPGCRDLIDSGKNGLLVPLKDAVALADALQRLAENSQERQEMGAAARRMVENSYSSDIIKGRLKSVFLSLL